MNDAQEKIYRHLLNNGFVPADIESHAVIKNFDADNLLYEMTPCLTITWNEELNTLYKIIDGSLCIANFYPVGNTGGISDGEFSFFVTRPRKEHDLQCIVDTLYRLSVEAGLNALHIWDIEERFVDNYKNLHGYRTEICYNDSMSEYVFTAESLLDLDGSVNMEKRRQLRKFLDKPNIELEPITKENIALCLDIEEKWCRSQDCNLCRSYAGCSKGTMRIMAGIFDGCAYQGFLGYIDGIPAGYIIYEKVNEDIAYFYFAKTTVSNFSVYLYYIVVQQFMSKAKMINIGADLGINGLRLFKKRLGVHKILKKYLCTFFK